MIDDEIEKELEKLKEKQDFVEEENDENEESTSNFLDKKIFDETKSKVSFYDVDDLIQINEMNDTIESINCNPKNEQQTSRSQDSLVSNVDSNENLNSELNSDLNLNNDDDDDKKTQTTTQTIKHGLNPIEENSDENEYEIFEETQKENNKIIKIYQENISIKIISEINRNLVDSQNLNSLEIESICESKTQTNTINEYSELLTSTTTNRLVFQQEINKIEKTDIESNKVEEKEEEEEERKILMKILFLII